MTVVTKSELLILIALLFLRPQLAVGHDGWIEITPAIVEKGQIATISLIQGNHSNEHRSYRIAGKWDQKYTTLVIVDPKGKQSALTDRIIDLGEDDEKVGPQGAEGVLSRSVHGKRRRALSGTGAPGENAPARRRTEVADQQDCEDRLCRFHGSVGIRGKESERIRPSPGR